MSHSRSLVASSGNAVCFTLALISCNAALRGKREGGGGRDMYVEKESGTVGSMVGEERGGRCRVQIDGSFRCHVCHATLSAYAPTSPIHTQTTCTSSKEVPVH